MKTDALSLFQLNEKIKACLQKAFDFPVWVIAEISELRINSSGHCYLELIEKAGDADHIIAKIKATVWSSTFRMLNPYFESTTGYKLAAGLKVLIRVQPEFHEIYGVNLVIKDIEPSYTIGDLARIKREILQRLKSEGVIDMNRMLPLPMVPQRIAVISSETAAGYGDFIDTLLNNPDGYHFRIELFAAQVQGDKAAESIIHSLERIYDRETEFDLVVIIRGGGAQSDLECFNNYDLVYHITQFPLPVISGIGHERDETITDIVAHTSVKTPTAVAGFLLEAVSEFDEMLDGLSGQLVSLATEKITAEKEKIFHFSQNTVYLVHEKLNDEKSIIVTLRKRLSLILQQFTERKNDKLRYYSDRTGFDCVNYLKLKTTGIGQTSGRLHRTILTSLKSKMEQVSAFEKNLEYLKPDKVLMRGYSISSSGGKLIKDSADLKEGDELNTKFFNGGSLSTVTRIIKK